MHTACLLTLLFLSFFGLAYSQRNPPPQSLNHYVTFLNQSADLVFNRMQQLEVYSADTRQFRTNSGTVLRLSSSGPIEDYYFRKALEIINSGLTTREKQQLNAEAEALWQLLKAFDQSAKALETYVRLKDYQRDGLKQSDDLLAKLQQQANQISRKRDGFYKRIEKIYRQYQPYNASDPYLQQEREMTQILARQKQVLTLWPYHLNEENPSDWPVDSIRESMVRDVELLAGFGKNEAKLAYPASSMIGSFRNALQSIQDLKQDAINDYTFSARQSARHGNAVYRNLLNHYNNDLRAFYESFVQYSASARPLLNFPKFCPVFVLETTVSQPVAIQRTAPFADLPLVAFKTKPAAAPASVATFQALNGYIDFINESLRQMNYLQIQVRNYQSSAKPHRYPAPNRRLGVLTYDHNEYKLPVADYQLLITNSKHIPATYRTSIATQAQVLMNILKEMDGLSIELIGYTQQKAYEQDRLTQSDAILDRYAVLFDTFDRKKEQLYTDVRRIHESYPAADPGSSWQVAGKALLNAIDQNRDALFGVKAFLKEETTERPKTDDLAATMRALITDEYKNLKGLTRYGRNNGLCPYSPYEDVAENTGRFAEKVANLKLVSQTNPLSGSHPYESFYYFYNGQLVYQYNLFSNLAKTGVLKMINQPNWFAFPRTVTASARNDPPIEKPELTAPVPARPAPAPTEAAPTLDGFATNNMVLLLDVSASMESPYKMPLLKKSIKSLLPLLRPEDQVSIVVYSGKAKVVLQPTSGAKTAEISKAIDQLRSTGETDGNEGIRAAYKVANKYFITGGNNRIILATDGEFPISEPVYESVEQFALKNINLTVLTFGRNGINSANLKKLATLGKGSYEHVTEEKAQVQLILEAQSKKAP